MTRTQRQVELEKDLEARLEQCRSFAAKVRLIVNTYGPLHMDNIYIYLGIDDGDRKHKERVTTALRDSMRTGRVVRTAPGTYGPGSQAHDREITRASNKKDVMWRVLRAKKAVTRQTLAELAAVSEHYAKEWLLTLEKMEVVRSHGNGKYRLINDTIAPPELTKNADKLRELRANHAQMRACLQRAKTAIDAACQIALQEV